jgi:integrase
MAEPTFYEVKNEMDKATDEWLNTLPAGTRVTYKCLWNHFLKFVDLTGDEILASRKADKNYSWEKKVLAFKNWFIAEGAAETSARTASSVVRGFFSFYRLPLKFRRTETTQLKKASRKYEDYRFSRDDLKRMFDVANLKEKYIVTAGKSFGLRAGDFLKLTRGDLEPYLDREPPISIGEYATEKEGVVAYPFIDIDAQPVIKLMLEKMDREGKTKPTDKILKFKRTIELTRNLKRIAQKAGLNVGNKVVRFHCLRKFLTDRLASFMSESKWKQIIGKKISEGAYVSPDSLRDDYTRAMAETCFTTTLEGDVAKIARLETLKQIAKSMGFSEEELSAISVVKRKGLKRTADDIIRDLEEQIKRKRQRTEPNGGCKNGVNCGERFEQIPEANLLEYLRQGYTIVHRLQGGEVIVKR